MEGGSLSRYCEPIEHIDSGINLTRHVPLVEKINIYIYIYIYSSK